MTIKHLERPQQQYDDFTINDDDTAAPVVISRQISRPASKAKRARPAERVLIDRKNIDDALPAAKAIASALCWINSGFTTMLTAAGIQTFITDRPSTWVAWLIGFIVALILTFGQVFTSERTRVGYTITLFPDALMTSFQWCQWLLLPLCLKLFPSWTVAVILAALAGGLIGIVSARLPERLTFGHAE
jgi:hypothetical protein